MDETLEIVLSTMPLKLLLQYIKRRKEIAHVEILTWEDVEDMQAQEYYEETPYVPV